MQSRSVLPTVVSSGGSRLGNMSSELNTVPWTISSLYKSELLSDIRIQIWNTDSTQQEQPTLSAPTSDPPELLGGSQRMPWDEPAVCVLTSSGMSKDAACGVQASCIELSSTLEVQPCSKRQKTGEAGVMDSNVVDRDVTKHARRGVLVADFPGHRMAFFAASPYFRAMIERWTQSDVIVFNVKEDEINAAQDLIYYVYHGRLPPGIDEKSKELRQIAVLADRHEMVECTRGCVEMLKLYLQSTHDAEALMEAIITLAALGPDNMACKPLLCAFPANAHSVRSTLQSYIVKEQDGNIQQVVDVLFSMFGHDFDKVWGEDRYRLILHLFPAAVVKGLLQRDDMVCMSENVIASAATEWVQAQHNWGLDVSKSEETELLELVRVPYLTTSYRSHVFPSLPWIADRHMAQASEMLLFGDRYAALAMGGGGRQVPDEYSCLGKWAAFSTPRKYAAAWQPLIMEHNFPWTSIHTAALRLELHNPSMGYGYGYGYESKPKRVVIDGPTVWYNGFKLLLGLEVASDASKVAISAFWCWDGPRLPEGSTHMIASNSKMSFWNVDGNGVNMGSNGMLLGANDGAQFTIVRYAEVQAITRLYKMSSKEVSNHHLVTTKCHLHVKLCAERIV